MENLEIALDAIPPPDTYILVMPYTPPSQTMNNERTLLFVGESRDNHKGNDCVTE